LSYTLSTANDASSQPPWLAWGAIALLLLVVAFGFELIPPQRGLFLFLNQLATHLPSKVWEICELLGNTSVIVVLFSPLLLRYPRAMASILASIPAGALASVFLKHLFNSPRPAAVFDAAQFHVIGPLLSAYSFPSGHSISAFATASALTVGLVHRSKTPYKVYLITLIVGTAAMVSFARIAVGAHWPVDVLAGDCIGWLAGLSGVWISYNKYPTLLKSLRHQQMVGLILFSVGLWNAWHSIEHSSSAPFMWFVAGCGLITVIGQFRTTLNFTHH
jgi:membrane-associated phospholipid phosphatase